ncbi:MAG: hypothetical protein JSS47_01110, partial [Proteobacteria bacterium]|nr:hypothetical protein [Pseudomonadota bacterium]
VVMQPSLAGQKPRATVRRLEEAGRVGAEITGPQRTTRWWYRPGTQGVEVEVLEGGKSEKHSITAMQ